MGYVSSLEGKYIPRTQMTLVLGIDIHTLWIVVFKTLVGCFILGIILTRPMGNICKDPYEPTSIMECHRGFQHCSLCHFDGVNQLLFIEVGGLLPSVKLIARAPGICNRSLDGVIFIYIHTHMHSLSCVGSTPDPAFRSALGRHDPGSLNLHLPRLHTRGVDPTLLMSHLP